MKKKLPFYLALLLILAMFAGCNSSNKAPASAITDEQGGSANGAAETEQSAEPESKVSSKPSPYNFANGDFAKDDKGFAAEKYEYALPLSTTEEVLRYWTCLYTPQFLTVDYQDSPFPMEVEKETGVHVEYIMIDRNNRADNFGTLLAADDLPDICSQVGWFYPGVFKDSITEENFFVNLYDYRDYMPNYMYEVMQAVDTDASLKASVFLEDDVIGAFYCLQDRVYPTTALFVRSDWLKRLNINRDDIITWDDTYNMLKAFKSQIPTAQYPALLYNTITGGAEHWLFYDTLGFCSSYGPTVMVDQNGKAYASNTTFRDKNLMTEINKWFMEGIFDPNWAAYDGTSNTILDQRMEGDNFGYLTLAVSDITGRQALIDDPACSWLMLPDPVLSQGQTLHVGAKGTRLYYGNASVSAKCENIPLAVTWLDWRYSPYGSEVMSWGVEGVSFEYDEEGNKKVSDFIYANPDFPGAITPLSWCYTNNIICDPGLDIGTAHYEYPGGEAVLAAFEYYETIQNNDYAYVWPADCVLTAEEQSRANGIMSDLATYITENYLAFVDGSTPLSQWDAYQEGLKNIGLNDYLAIYQTAYDNYIAG
jgi:putative aldouronate transport system substrate-binding protein